MAGLKNEGTSQTLPRPDDLLILKINSLDQVRLHLSIGDSLTNKNVDKCTLTEGKKVFLRYPYKYFLTVEGPGIFVIEAEFYRAGTVDLSEMSNK